MLTQGQLHKNWMLAASRDRAHIQENDHDLLSPTSRSRYWRVNSKAANTSAWHGGLSFPNRSSSQKHKSKFGFKTGGQNGSANLPRKWSTLLQHKDIYFLLILFTTGPRATSTIPWLVPMACNHQLLFQCIIDRCTRRHCSRSVAIRPHR